MRCVVMLMWCAFLAGCSTPQPPSGPARDERIDVASRVARAAFDRGEYESALGLYGKVLKRAYVLDDAPEIGDAAYNMAMCHIHLGEFDAAHAALAEARAEFQRCGGNIADVLLVEAKLAQRLGHREQALKLADEVLAAGADTSHRWQVALLTGNIACDQDDVAQAHVALAATTSMDVSDPTLLAMREELIGRILLLENDCSGAASAFDREAALYRSAQRYRAMALALGRAGEAYRQAGDEASAADRLLRSKRSLDAQ